MNQLLKAVIPPGVALLVGLIGGFVLGSSGKSALQSDLTAAKRQAEQATDALERERSRTQEQVARAKRSRLVLLAKEHLLRAQLELYANNYGLASQHLSQARSRLRNANKHMLSHRAQIKALFEEMNSAQTLIGRLDPMARAQVQDLVVSVGQLPGGG